MRIFLDTNVLYDIVSRRQPFARSSLTLLVMRAFEDAELWTAPQSFLDVYYVGCRQKILPPDRLQAVLGLYAEKINVCTVSHEDMGRACAAGWNDMEDALIGILCKKVAADYLITRDARQPGFATLGVPAFDPEGFFAMLERDEGVAYADTTR